MKSDPHAFIAALFAIILGVLANVMATWHINKLREDFRHLNDRVEQLEGSK